MKTEQEKQSADFGGRHYPRKMAHGWCVAHRLMVMGTTIERFGAKFNTYPEAYEAAARLNRAENRIDSTEVPSGQKKEAKA